MGNEIIQADYEKLEDIAKRFEQHAAQNQQMVQRIRQQIDNLMSNGWIGKAATDFQAEFTEQVYPALNRAVKALQDARDITLRVSEIVKQAEEEASKLFKNNSSQLPPKGLEPREQNQNAELMQAGIEKLRKDGQIYGSGKFPDNYYDEFSRYMFKEILKQNGGNYREAFSILNALQSGDLGSELQQAYTQIVGTDIVNGWDKVRHFIFTAWLQEISGGFLLPEGFTYSKETLDEIEQFLGRDPEGYSLQDIYADNLGEAFAEEIAKKRREEFWEELKKVVVGNK